MLKTKKYTALLLAAIMICLTLLSGCKTEIGLTAGEPAPTNYPVTVGELIFEDAPKSVASLSPAITDMLFELGYGEKLIGRSKYCDYPDAQSRTVIGSSVKPSVEMILAIKPELLITQSPIAKTDRDTLEDAGIKILIINTPSSFEELMECYVTLSEIFGGNLGAKAAANACMNDFAVALSEVKKDGTLVYLMTDDYGCATDDTLAGEILDYFGDNAAASYEKYEFPEDELIAANPDTIIISQPLTAESFGANFQTLDAVQSGRVIYVDSTCFERPTAKRLAEFVRSFGEKVNALPELKHFEQQETTSQEN